MKQQPVSEHPIWLIKSSFQLFLTAPWALSTHIQDLIGDLSGTMTSSVKRLMNSKHRFVAHPCQERQVHMKRSALTTLILLFVWVSIASAFDAVGTIKKVDAEKGVLHIHANGRDRVVTIAQDARILGEDGKPLTKGLQAAELKEGVEVTVTVDRGGSGPVITSIRLGRHAAAAAPVATGKATVGFKPLSEMSATEKYKDEEGGLYGGGSNEPPATHLAAAKKQTAMIEPLNADGMPDKNGTIALVSISMSNATQEFSFFMQLADADKNKSSKVTIVDCAQGGQAMAQWVDPKARAWTEADRRLTAAKVSPRQVQVAWIKLANVRPTGDLKEHGSKLKKDTLAVIHNAKERFPNLRVAYLGSRIYGGYATGNLNPEPYAYEGAFAVRWLIQDQIKGEKELRYDSAGGDAKSPVLLWGPYLWADGTTARKADGLTWNREDFVSDGVHPSPSGRRKVADMLLTFFKTDSLTATWFVGK